MEIKQQKNYKTLCDETTLGQRVKGSKDAVLKQVNG